MSRTAARATKLITLFTAFLLSLALLPASAFASNTSADSEGTIATFTANKHKVTRSISGKGSLALVSYSQLPIATVGFGSGVTYTPYPGTVLYLKAVAKTGYKLDSVSCVQKKTGKKVAISKVDYCPGYFKFTMPNDDVTLKAKFVVSRKNIEKAKMTNGKIVVTGSNATMRPQVGSKVRIRAVPNKGYKLASISYMLKTSKKTMTPKKVANTTNTYEFKMPDENVTLKATFKTIIEQPNLTTDIIKSPLLSTRDIPFRIINRSSKSITVLSTGYLSNPNKSQNRKLHLQHQTKFYPISSQTLPANCWDTFNFRIQGQRSWFGAPSKITINFKFNGATYRGYVHVSTGKITCQKM